MKRPIPKRTGESGQSTLLVIVAMSIFLLGAVGLAIDGSHLYAQRQMAQAAADGAAQAGILSIFNTAGSGMGTHTAGTAFTCSASDAATPCQYAQSLNGFNAPSPLDTVSVDFPSAATVGIPSGSLSGSDPVNIIRVTVQRQVSTTLIRFLGPSLETISARGTAAIVETPSAIPIIVTHPSHPSKGGALSFNGNPSITITGGPNRSIQVNSQDDPGAIDTTSCSNATVDLSKAGPDGKGADFANGGGPGGSPCFTFLPGVGSYVDPASAIQDPFANVPVPSTTGMTVNPPTQTVAVGTDGCVAVAGGPATCTLYSPGLYNTANGITVKDSKANGLALFAPGMYYISQGGFNMLSNSAAAMATGMTADPLFPEIGTAGMVVFNSGTGTNDIFNFSSNAGALSPGITLHGPPEDSKWEGILFYEDPDPATGGSHTGLPSGNPAHQIWGAGTLSLTGTIYINSRSGVTATSFQGLALGGGGGSNTTVTGEIIVNTLSLGGNGQINMNLDSIPRLVRQVALVQ